VQGRQALYRGGLVSATAVIDAESKLITSSRKPDYPIFINDVNRWFARRDVNGDPLYSCPQGDRRTIELGTMTASWESALHPLRAMTDTQESFEVGTGLNVWVQSTVSATPFGGLDQNATGSAASVGLSGRVHKSALQDSTPAAPTDWMSGLVTHPLGRPKAELFAPTVTTSDPNVAQGPVTGTSIVVHKMYSVAAGTRPGWGMRLYTNRAVSSVGSTTNLNNGHIETSVIDIDETTPNEPKYYAVGMPAAVQSQSRKTITFGMSELLVPICFPGGVGGPQAFQYIGNKPKAPIPMRVESIDTQFLNPATSYPLAGPVYDAKEDKFIWKDVTNIMDSAPFPVSKTGYSDIHKGMSTSNGIGDVYTYIGKVCRGLRADWPAIVGGVEGSSSVKLPVRPELMFMTDGTDGKTNADVRNMIDAVTSWAFTAPSIVR
jgi:hypothetical protein